APCPYIKDRKPKSVLKKGSDSLGRDRRDSKEPGRILGQSKGSDPFFNTLSTPEIAQFEERMTDQSEQPTGTLAQDDLEAVRRLRDAFDSIKKQLARVI